MTISNGKQLTLTAVLMSVAAHFAWQVESTKTNSSLRGLCALPNRVLWASGSGGTLLRSLDGGRNWQRSTLDQDAAKLDFRDIEGFDAQHAIAMSSGPGALSNLYRTDDGGAHWMRVFANPDPEGFFDALKIWNSRQGVLVGDPVRATVWLNVAWIRPSGATSASRASP